MIEVWMYDEDTGFGSEEIIWVQQEGYDGAWLTDKDPRFAKLKPILDLTEELCDRWDFEHIKELRLTKAEWDAITDGALVP